MHDITRRGAIALGMVAVASAATHALAEVTPVDGQTGKLVVVNDVTTYGVSQVPTWSFHVVARAYVGDAVILDEVIELGEGESREYELPYGSRYEVTQLDEPEGWFFGSIENSEWWIYPNGTRTVTAHNYRIFASLRIHADFDSENYLPFEVVFRDEAGEVWSDEVVWCCGSVESQESPIGYTYEVDYVGDDYCHLSIEPATGVVRMVGYNDVAVSWHPHGHMKVRKDVGS